VTGSINGRVGTEKNCIVSDILNKLLLDAIEFLEYETDELFPKRLTEDLRSPIRFPKFKDILFVLVIFQEHYSYISCKNTFLS
jgi:hypothetical protein